MPGNPSPVIQAQTDRLNKLCVKFGFEFDINPNTVKPYALYLMRLTAVERAKLTMDTKYPGMAMGDFIDALKTSVTELTFQELHARLVSRLRNCVLLK